MRSDAMAGETWEARVNEIGRTVLDVARRRGSAAARERRPDEAVAVTQAG
jgi:hypothetical protein